MEEIEKLCLCCIQIKFSSEKVIRSWGQANYDFRFESRGIFLEEKCATRKLGKGLIDSGEQVWGFLVNGPDLFTAFLIKTESLTYPKRKNPANSTLCWVLTFFEIPFCDSVRIQT